MTHKQRMLATIRGEPTDRLPWAPRLDLWHRANRQAGTLPSKYRNATLMEMVDDLGWGYHAVIPDFQDLRSEADDADRALGLYNLHTMPVWTIFEGVRREIRRDGDRTHVAYHTPAGTLTTTKVYDDSMRRAGITITHVEKYAIKSPADFEAVGWLFDRARAVPNYDGFRSFADGVGERGIAVAFAAQAASPMHLIQRDLMPMEQFFFAMADHPEELANLAARIVPYWRAMLQAVADGPAEVVMIGANYDSAIQYPPFFAEHITPWLREAADLLHARGKYLLTHTDGENTGLLRHYLDSGFDIADSICPKPMTKLTYKDVRDALAGKVTILGGIPSVALLRDSMSDRDFDALVDQFFADLGSGDHAILGISDTTPPAADFDRLMKLARAADAFGPVRPSKPA